MDITTPNKLNGKWILLSLSVLVLMGVLIGFLWFLPSGDKEEATGNMGMSDVMNAVTQIQTNADFWNTLTPKKEAEVVTPTIAPKPEKKEVAKLTFDQVFEQTILEKETTDTQLKNFLHSANHSAEIRTFKAFGDFNTELEQLKDPIALDYNSERNDTSYPIDFSRTLTVDRNISAILIQEIDSTLAGKVTAQVEDNIYATHGRFILIPAGSRAIGYYQPLEKVGDTRLQIRWTRIITPVGVDIIFDAEMADQMGRSGLGGEVDTRFFDRYGLALLVSTINAIGQYSVSTDSENQAIFVNTYGEDLSNLSAQILEEQINIKPVIRINAGARILISPSSDIWFRDVDGQIIVQAANFNEESNNDIQN